MNWSSWIRPREKFCSALRLPSGGAQEQAPIGHGNSQPGRKGATQFHRPGIFAGRLADLPGQCQRRHQGFRRRQGPKSFTAVLHCRCRRPTRRCARRKFPPALPFRPTAKELYVAGNLSNRLVELDAATGKVLRTWDVGVAPFDVVLAGQKIYVSNWGGRRPDADSVTGPAGQRHCARGCALHRQRRLGVHH